MEKIKFISEDEKEVEFFVEEQTRVNGTSYLLVSDSDEDEANAYIMKDVSPESEAEAEYVMVDDEIELDAIAGVFAQMMDDVDLR
jgi:glutathionylspermidine synthase